MVEHLETSSSLQRPRKFAHRIRERKNLPDDLATVADKPFILTVWRLVLVVEWTLKLVRLHKVRKITAGLELLHLGLKGLWSTEEVILIINGDFFLRSRNALRQTVVCVTTKINQMLIGFMLFILLVVHRMELVGDRVLDLIDVLILRDTTIDLALVPLGIEVLRIGNSTCGQKERTLAAIDANRLEAAILLLIVVGTLLGLREYTESGDVAIVMCGEDAVVKDPLGRARAGLINNNQSRRVRRDTAPELLAAPLDLHLDDLRGVGELRVIVVDEDVEVLELWKAVDVLDELVDRLVFLAKRTLGILEGVGETKNDDVALGIILHTNTEVAENLTCLRRELVHVVLDAEEWLGFEDEVLIEELSRSAEAARRGIADLNAFNHLVHHRGCFIDVVREENFLRGGTVEDVGDEGVLTDLTPEASENLTPPRAVITLVEMEDHTLSEHVLTVDLSETGCDLLFRGDGEDLELVLTKLVALNFICLAMPARDEEVDARRLVFRIKSSKILNHLTLTGLDGRTDNNTTDVLVTDEGNHLLLEEGDEVRAVETEVIY